MDMDLLLHWNFMSNVTPSMLNRGEHEVLRAQPLHEERDQGWEYGSMCRSLLQGQQVQVLDIQPKVKHINFNFLYLYFHLDYTTRYSLVSFSMPRVKKCWLKTSGVGKTASTKGSFSGQKACGAPGYSAGLSKI